jgi:hypothetical protein
MPSSRLSLLLVLIGVLIASLGSSFAGEAEDSTAATSLKAKAAPVSKAMKASQPAPTRAVPSARPATGDNGAQQCTAKGPAGEDIYPPLAAACPTGWPWTCCPCGGCGCRPPWMSPASFCAC